MTLHRTPVHHRVLGMVRDGRVVWRDAEPHVKGVLALRRPAGFAHGSGGRLEPGVLVALWELRHAELIVVDGDTVELSGGGRARLAEWDATRAVAR